HRAVGRPGLRATGPILDRILNGGPGDRRQRGHEAPRRRVRAIANTLEDMNSILDRPTHLASRGSNHDGPRSRLSQGNARQPRHGNRGARQEARLLEKTPAVPLVLHTLTLVEYSEAARRRPRVSAGTRSLFDSS